MAHVVSRFLKAVIFSLLIFEAVANLRAIALGAGSYNLWKEALFDLCSLIV